MRRQICRRCGGDYRENSAFGHCFFIEIATAGQISPRTLFGRDDKKGTVFFADFTRLLHCDDDTETRNIVYCMRKKRGQGLRQAYNVKQYDEGEEKR